MQMLKYFMECYFCQTFYFEDLDNLIQDFKKSEHEPYYLQFIRELHQIIQTKNYKLASQIMKKYGGKILNIEETERVIRYIYDKLLGKNVTLDATGFYKDCKVVFCPICCPVPEEIKDTWSLIQKATIIKTGQQIYICKPCKLVWVTEDIQANNALDYKKFMKSLDLKGLWKELCDVDLL